MSIKLGLKLDQAHNERRAERRDAVPFLTTTAVHIHTPRRHINQRAEDAKIDVADDACQSAAINHHATSDWS
jgi:hypothetical protein